MPLTSAHYTMNVPDGDGFGTILNLTDAYPMQTFVLVGDMEPGERVYVWGTSCGASYSRLGTFTKGVTKLNIVGGWFVGFKLEREGSTGLPGYSIDIALYRGYSGVTFPVITLSPGQTSGVIDASDTTPEKTYTVENMTPGARLHLQGATHNNPSDFVTLETVTDNKCYILKTALPFLRCKLEGGTGPMHLCIGATLLNAAAAFGVQPPFPDGTHLTNSFISDIDLGGNYRQVQHRPGQGIVTLGHLDPGDVSHGLHYGIEIYGNEWWAGPMSLTRFLYAAFGPNGISMFRADPTAPGDLYQPPGRSTQFTLGNLQFLFKDQVTGKFPILYDSWVTGPGPDTIRFGVNNVEIGDDTAGNKVIYFKNGTANPPGFRHNNGTGKIEYSHDGLVWTALP